MGKVVNLTVRKSSDIQNLVTKFCQEKNLPISLVDPLSAEIGKHLDKHFKRREAS